LTRKVGHSDLVFGMSSGFISTDKSVHARLQVQGGLQNRTVFRKFCNPVHVDITIDCEF